MEYEIVTLYNHKIHKAAWAIVSSMHGLAPLDSASAVALALYALCGDDSEKQESFLRLVAEIVPQMAVIGREKE